MNSLLLVGIALLVNLVLAFCTVVALHSLYPNWVKTLAHFLAVILGIVDASLWASVVNGSYGLYMAVFIVAWSWLYALVLFFLRYNKNFDFQNK